MVFLIPKFPVSIRFSFYITPILVVAIFIGGAAWGSDLVKITNEDSVSDNGTVDIAWEKADEVEVTLEQASSEDFEEALVRYVGLDEGSVITGLPEGVHYFRVRGTGEKEWSKPLVVTVEFFDRGKLFLILGIGAVVVLATIGTIVSGHFNTKDEEAEV